MHTFNNGRHFNTGAIQITSHVYCSAMPKLLQQ